MTTITGPTANTAHTTPNYASSIETVEHSDTDPAPQHPGAFHSFHSEVTGLKGKLLRIVTDLPTDDAAVPQDQLPHGITDVIADDDEVSVNLTVRVYPVGDPSTIAYIRYDQLALYNNN
jgi:hypothetical protein